MGKPTICIGENKGADQYGSSWEADQRLCFCCTDSTILCLPKSEISSFEPASVTVQTGLCGTWSEPKLLVSHAQAHIIFYKIQCIVHGFRHINNIKL